jgi:hypothetical protein
MYSRTELEDLAKLGGQTGACARQCIDLQNRLGSQGGVQHGVEAVREFHVKNGFWNGTVQFHAPREERLRNLLDMTHFNLLRSSEKLMEMFHTLTHESDKALAMRLHLIGEEVAEAFDAASDGDEVRFLDALADSTYVINGSAVTFDLPLGAAFYEVHRSNMTKQKVDKDADKERLRDKGPDYRPPDLKRVLTAHRNQRQMEKDAPSTASSAIKYPRDQDDNSTT